MFQEKYTILMEYPVPWFKVISSAEVIFTKFHNHYELDNEFPWMLYVCYWYDWSSATTSLCSITVKPCISQVSLSLHTLDFIEVNMKLARCDLLCSMCWTFQQFIYLFLISGNCLQKLLFSGLISHEPHCNNELTHTLDIYNLLIFIKSSFRNWFHYSYFFSMA